MSCLFQWFVIYILWLETFCTTHSNKCFAFYLFVFHLNQCWGNLGCWRCFITGALPVYSEMGQRIFCAPLKKKIKKNGWMKWCVQKQALSFKFYTGSAMGKLLSLLIGGTASNSSSRKNLSVRNKSTSIPSLIIPLSLWSPSSAGVVSI